MNRHTIFKAACSVTGVILIAKLLGFVKQMASAALFGATLKTDLIMLSQNFVGDIQYVLAQVLLTAFTAVYIRVREQDSLKAQQFISNTVKVFTMIAVALSVLVFAAAPVIAKIIAPTYAETTSAQLSAYLRQYAPLLALFVWTAVFQSLLNANKRFVPGEMVSVNQSLIFLLLVFCLRDRLAEESMIVAFFTYTVWNTLFLGILSRKYWGYAGGNPWVDPAVRELLRMIGPLLLGYSMIYINQQVNKILVSGLGDGAVTALGYAAVLSNLVSTFIVSFCSILFTYVATAISQNAHGQASQLAVRATGVLSLLFLPVSILTVLCAKDIVSIAFGRGAFDAAAVETAAYALMGYGLNFVPLILREVFSRFQYGYQESRVPMINSTIGIAITILLSITLCPIWGVFGVALASSVSVTVCGLLNLLTARRLNRQLNLNPLLRQLPWMLLGGLLCTLIAHGGNHLWQNQPALIRFALVTLTAGGAYALSVSPLLLRLLRQIKTGGSTAA